MPVARWTIRVPRHSRLKRRPQPTYEQLIEQLGEQFEVLIEERENRTLAELFAVAELEKAVEAYQRRLKWHEAIERRLDRINPPQRRTEPLNAYYDPTRYRRNP